MDSWIKIFFFRMKLVSRTGSEADFEGDFFNSPKCIRNIKAQLASDNCDTVTLDIDNFATGKRDSVICLVGWGSRTYALFCCDCLCPRDFHNHHKPAYGRHHLQ